MEEFYKNNNNIYKLSYRCKKCIREKQKLREKLPKKKVEKKQCTSCKITKPISEYHNRKTTSDGYNIYCEECSRKKAKANYAKNKCKYLKTKKDKRQLLKDTHESPL